LCIVHMQGTPETMQDDPFYPDGVVDIVKGWFSRQIDLLLAAGANLQQIILDPGIGFGKTVAHNLEILHNLAEFKEIGFPVLVGVSRKSFIARILQKKGEEILPATLALTTVALLAGVDLLRVHDVAETADIVKVMKAYKDV
jgi:dihydropteroate synthase